MTEESEYLIEAESRPVKTGQARPVRTGHVLVVDDDHDVLLTLAAVLRSEGHEVEVARDVADAGAALNAGQFDVLVVDVRLKSDADADGITLLGDAVKDQPDLIGIVLTGYGSLESAIGALEAGAFSYLLKPCNIDQLKAAVDRGLEKRATTEAMRELQQAGARAEQDRTEAQLHELERREEEARRAAARATERVGHLQAITTQLARYMEVDKLLEQVVQASSQLLESRIAAVFLLPRPDADFFECAASEGLETGTDLRISRQRSLAARTIDERRTLAVDDVRREPMIALPKLAGGKQVGSIIVAPIWNDGSPLGVIEVYTTASRHWNQDEIELLSALAAAAGVALASARVHEDLQRATRMRDEVLASVTHDLKTPLTTISGVAQLLRRREAAAAADLQVLSGLDTIHKMAGTMAGLIDELMDTVRLQHGEPLELHLATCDLMALARDLVEDYRRTLMNHQLILSGPDALIGQWDAQRLRRVLDNLLSNAIKYSPRGGEIELRLARLGGQAVIQLKDGGIGIAEPDIPTLFDPFKRGRNVGAIAGSGLGLAGVKRLVELHGGSIEVESASGHGSMFTVRLPLRQALR